MSNSDYRVSLKFSEKDTDQEEVVKLLKQMGRRKSAFITKAIKFYLRENPEDATSNIPINSFNKSSLKSMLKEILSEMNLGELTAPPKEEKIEIQQPIEKIEVENKQKEVETKEPEKEVENITSSPVSAEEPSKKDPVEIPDDMLDTFVSGLDVWGEDSF